MKKTSLPNTIFILISGLFLMLAVTGCEQKKSEDKVVPTDIKKLVEEKCSMCHFSDRIYKDKRSREEWEGVVQKMRTLNPTWISEEEGNAILQYLAKNASQ